MNETTEIISLDVLMESVGFPGRMITGSKSGYSRWYPENVAIFNANIVVPNGSKYVKVWHGDLDLTVDHEMLIKLSELSGKKVYVLFEMDARFNTEGTPKVDRFVASYDASRAQNLQVEAGPFYETRFEQELNVIKWIKL